MTANVFRMPRIRKQYVKTPTAPLATGPEVFFAPHTRALPNSNKI